MRKNDRNKVIPSFILILLISVLLFLVSCQPQAKTAETPTDATTNVSVEGCVPHWECLDENYNSYQLENCTWLKPEKCERGCFNASCRPAEICKVGFKCIDENRRGYQKEDCSFATKSDCEWGCLEGKCQEKPANATNTTNVTIDNAATTSSSGYSAIAENAEENETIAKGPLYTLQLGEEGQFVVDGTTHTIKIHNLEVDKVIIKVDDIKSDWLAEDGSFTYANIGTTVTIKSILFQAYGKKEIEYFLS